MLARVPAHPPSWWQLTPLGISTVSPGPMYDDVGLRKKKGSGVSLS
jgi:hypothetical protein